ncbi:5'-3' exonuclease H3TH domain-containing protein [Gracilibacillus marinus]|uniref:5'-3' exonuclease n=1 Tax=Gracilibacillus marinus TaxID=630535 RepID=A0ABV8VXP9_9BACI
MTRKKLLIIDGMALLFRGFYATSFTGNFMLNSKGIPRNGLFGFMNYFTDAIHTFEPTHILCCWDMGSKTFRNELFTEYKSNRQAPPEQLIPQFDLCKDVVTAFQIPNIGIVGYEADDCIGSIAKRYHNEFEITIVSGDKDLLQIVGTNIQVAIMKKGTGNYEVYTSENFFEKLQLRPEQIIDMKALMGDTADNYPGVKGVGEKTALKLLQQFDSVANLLKERDSLTKTMHKKITEYEDDLHISKKLATILTNMEIELDLSMAEWKNDHTSILSFLKDELEFSNTDRWLKKLKNDIQQQ